MEIQDIREQIDKVDSELLDLFIRRMGLCADVADYKAKSGKAVLDAGREREILARVSKNSPEELSGYSRQLFSTLMRLSRSYQDVRLLRGGELSELIAKAAAETPKEFPKTSTVACQGIEGAYSQQACDKVFSFADIMYFKNFGGVFNAVEKGLCKYGVLPIENSSHGTVNNVYDLMRNHSFYIVRSTKLHIRHDLLAADGADISGIKEICSHEQAIGQCSKLIASMPGVKVTFVENTAAAARFVAESGRTDLAALSSPECAEIYGLKSLKSAVQDSDNNHTRFIVISKKPEIYPGSERMSIMFSASNTAGSLSEVLSRFASLGVNLTKLESRPVVGTDFEYVFYADLDGSVHSADLCALLDSLKREMKLFVFLGAYSEV